MALYLHPMFADKTASQATGGPACLRQTVEFFVELAEFDGEQTAAVAAAIDAFEAAYKAAERLDRATSEVANDEAKKKLFKEAKNLREEAYTAFCVAIGGEVRHQADKKENFGRLNIGAKRIAAVRLDGSLPTLDDQALELGWTEYWTGGLSVMVTITGVGRVYAAWDSGLVGPEIKEASYPGWYRYRPAEEKTAA